MKKIAINAFVIAGMFMLAGCFGQHNQAPSKGINLDSERIYGTRGGEPKQLQNKYPDDEGSVAERAQKIRDKFFPK
jgi:hypothetical protein